MKHDVLNDYLSDILNNGESHQKPFREDFSNFTLENLTAGILKIIPKKTEDSLGLPIVLSCGVHGNETAPIEIINDIVRDLAQGKLDLKRPCLIIFGHLEAMRTHKRFIDFNMNRLFCGNHQNYPEALESPRARELESHVSQFFKEYGVGHHYDLHTAIRPSHLKRFAVYPTSKNGVPEQEEIDSLKKMGIEGLLVAGGKASTFSAYTHQTYQAKGYTLELGKVEPFGQNKREDFQQAEVFLRATLADNTEPLPQGAPLKIYNVDHEMIRDSEDYVLHLAEDYANFTPLQVGVEIETTQDGTLTAQANQAVVFPNSKVVIGQRTGLLVSLVKEV